jgi:hypothetical protein
MKPPLVILVDAASGIDSRTVYAVLSVADAVAARKREPPI